MFDTVKNGEGPIKDGLLEISHIIASQRERYGISIKDLSARLRLRYDILEKIESGNFELMDERVNIIGYISLICKEIDLNEKIILSKVGFSEESLLGKGVIKKVIDGMDVFSYSDLKKENRKWFSFSLEQIKKVKGKKAIVTALSLILILLLIKVS